MNIPFFYSAIFPEIRCLPDGKRVGRPCGISTSATHPTGISTSITKSFQFRSQFTVNRPYGVSLEAFTQVIPSTICGQI